MLHPFDQTAPTFAQYFATFQVKPSVQASALKTGERLLKDLSAYKDLEKESKVPALWSMCTNERESDGDLRTFLGNGDPLNKKSTHVPRGYGPFATWAAGAQVALHIDGVDKVAVWNPARACFEWVTFNGWGYGLNSPYVTAGTQLQKIGKYEADGKFNPDAWDTQLGCLTIMWGILQHEADLAFSIEGSPSIVPTIEANPTTENAPITVGGSVHDAKWLQAALNRAAEIDQHMSVELAHLGLPKALDVDGNFGRQTQAFVRAFEIAQDLSVDRGYSGPEVLGALNKVLGPNWVPAT